MCCENQCNLCNLCANSLSFTFAGLGYLCNKYRKIIENHERT